ncbi:MAG: NifU family protein [Elusimicrobiota bacterium]|nr:NifU family protein [Elusimicrobiota bacterium]
MKDKVLDVINKLKPFLQADGGDIELVDVDEKNGIVKVKLKGACSACPMSIVTLKEGVETKIKQEVPEVKKVVAV